MNHTMKYLHIFITVALLAGCGTVNGLEPDRGTYISWKSGPGYVAVASGQRTAPIWFSGADHRGVVRALEDLQSDLEKVTGTRPLLVDPDTRPDGGSGSDAGIILAGTIGMNPLVDRLIEEDKLDVAGVAGRWEASVTTLVKDPFPGVSGALVIAGSDKRGTIYGIYELSRQIGISPWHYWADVVPAHHDEIHARPGIFLLEEPAVKYRGIFINDEAPALSGWVHENFGSFNHEFYARVFELILRMKGNYLWPAMWGRAFYDDDTLNAPLADMYGVVIGTTHHEPLMRAHVEWSRYGHGPWDYSRNADTLREFWREGMERMGDYESIVSIGMRGDGDAPMTRGTAIALLESIVAEQRNIIGETTGKDPAEVPQLWALYKEVQEYYDQGMRVPDDVTLLLCDDNWGNLRKLPLPEERHRSGGYGIYYHFDYVGGPRNYKWLNTNQIERVWEQMRMAYHYGADRIWIVNVGDIKPMELPTEFFLDMAWDPDRWEASDLPSYYESWAARQFGTEYAGEIAGILEAYTKFNARRKPELISPGTYSLVRFREAENVVNEYNQLARKAEALYEKIPEQLKDAYFQLVLFPVMACANLNDMYVSAAKNRLYAAQGRASTNRMAERVRELFRMDSDLTARYHHEMAGGKWNHMMSQTHIGYTYWQEPRRNNMPDVIEITVPRAGRMGIALEGSEESWPGSDTVPLLPRYDPAGNQDYYLEVFNRGNKSFECTISPSEPWITPEKARFTVEEEMRIHITVDWEKAPEGMHRAPVKVAGGGRKLTFYVVIDNRVWKPEELSAGTFVESGGFISMEAPHYQKAVDAEGIRWTVVPNLGKTLSSVIALPVTAQSTEPGEGSPHLQYRFFVRDTGNVVIRAYLSPTLNFNNSEGLRFAVSLDGGIPRTVNMHDPDNPRIWEKWVADNIIIKPVESHISEPGLHTLEFWRIDPGVVLQKIVIETLPDADSGYLGPPESPRISP